MLSLAPEAMLGRENRHAGLVMSSSGFAVSTTKSALFPAANVPRSSMRRNLPTRASMRRLLHGSEAGRNRVLHLDQCHHADPAVAIARCVTPQHLAHAGGVQFSNVRDV